MRVSELFLSLQGEGLRVGHPSVFLRLFGCNFKCPSFGLPKGQFSTEPDEFAKHIADYNSYSDLPLAKTGCDSYPSWHPKFKQFSPDITTDELASRIEKLVNGETVKTTDLVITGGEPLLRNHQKEIIECFAKHDIFKKFKRVTFETNCTQNLTQEFQDFIKEIHKTQGVIFSCSPKLECSGVEHDKAIKPEVLKQYSSLADSYLKFVVNSEVDLDEVRSVIKEFGTDVDVYLMPEGGTTERYNLNMKKVADICQDNGYIFSPRLHVTLYGNAWAK